MISDQVSGTLAGLHQGLVETRRMLGKNVKSGTLHDRGFHARGHPLSQMLFMGEIQSAGPAGEADYADARYWIKVKMPDSDAATYNQLIGTSVLKTTDPSALQRVKWFTATNLSEQLLGGHTLTVGTPVVVLAIPEEGMPLNKWFVIVGTGGGSTLPVGQYQYMVFGNVAQNQTGFFFPRAHPVI